MNDKRLTCEHIGWETAIHHDNLSVENLPQHNHERSSVVMDQVVGGHQTLQYLSGQNILEVRRIARIAEYRVDEGNSTSRSVEVKLFRTLMKMIHRNCHRAIKECIASFTRRCPSFSVYVLAQGGWGLKRPPYISGVERNFQCGFYSAVRVTKHYFPVH